MTFFFLLHHLHCQKKLEFHNQREKKAQYKNKFAETGIDNSISCDYCFCFDFHCHMIPNKMNHSFKCSKCFKASMACFYTSWVIFDHQQNNLKQKIKAGETHCDQFLLEFSQVQAQLASEKKTLKKK